MMNKQKNERIRINRRPSKPKISSQKQLNMTVTGKMFQRQIKQTKLPPLPSFSNSISSNLNQNQTLRKTFSKITTKPNQRFSKSREKEQTNEKKNELVYPKQRFETETTTNLTQSTLFQSYYMTISKNWIKPSDYIKDIKQLNLLSEEEDIDVTKYQIKLNEANSKNLQKIQSLFSLVEKWSGILKRALFYVTSQKTSSDKLSEQVRFWKVLSKKFDELEYEFNDKKTTELVSLMTRIARTNPQQKKLFEEFIELKNQAIKMTHPVKRLYLSLEETITGKIQKFQQSSDIGQSIVLLKNIMLSFQLISQEQTIMTNRLEVVYKKMDLCMIQKLLAAPLYPHQLTNISKVNTKYQLLDKASSFYSHFISILQQEQNMQLQGIIERVEYTRSVVLNLSQILSYFEFLYNKKDVKQFSKLFVNNIDYNIYDIVSKQQWISYMAVVQQSMENHKYQP